MSCARAGILTERKGRLMKNRIIRGLGLFLALLTVALLAVSCAGVADEPNSGSSAEPTATEPATATTDTSDNREQPDRLNIIQNGKTDYVIVRSLAAKDWEISLSKLFCDTIQTLTGVAIPIVDDFEDAAAGETRTEKEIIFGTTNRENEYTVDYSAIGDGYQVFVSYERLVFASKSETGLYFAVRKFFENIFSVNIETDTLKRLDYTDLSVSAKYRSVDQLKSGVVPYLDVDFGSYTVAYATGDYMQKRMALLLSDALKEKTGLKLGCVETNALSEMSIVLHNTDADGKSLQKGHWELAVSGKTIHVRASDYYGFGGVASYFKAAYKNGHYDFKDGFSEKGDYTTALTAISASTAYAYRRAGDNRVMFYNALWGNGSGDYNFPTAERNLLQAQMVAQYLPDVIGFQEMDNAKRSGEGSLAALLAVLGYAETVDPCVDNDMKVNYTPLFYNQNTTKLIKSEYVWYTAQDTGAGKMDQSSKALTWGVFENKKTGDRYIAISTHMCTRDDTVRGRQAQEAIALIAELVNTYHCPVFLGGDMNGTAEAANYRAFAAAGYTDVQKTSAVTTNVNTHAPYPSYNSDLGMIRPSGTVSLNPNSIDHIFLANGESVSLKLFGVVADECTRSASDHFPMFADFSFAGKESTDAAWSGRY